MNNVSKPTITVYSPKENNTGVAVVVIPGGGYKDLAMDLEGTEICVWLTSKGITAVLLKYRVHEIVKFRIFMFEERIEALFELGSLHN